MCVLPQASVSISFVADPDLLAQATVRDAVVFFRISVQYKAILNKRNDPERRKQMNQKKPAPVPKIAPSHIPPTSRSKSWSKKERVLRTIRRSESPRATPHTCVSMENLNI